MILPKSIKISPQLIFISLTTLTFLIYKFSQLTLRFGDGNAYFYMGKALLEGNLPYRDFFVVVPPTMIYFFGALYPVFGTKVELYQSLPILLEVLNALVLYLVLKKINLKLAFLAPLVYLFTFTIVATSDYFTGVQLAVSFALLGTLFHLQNRPVLSGIFWGLACFTKFYMFPPLFGLLIYLSINKQFHFFLKLILGFSLTSFIIIGPYLVLAPQQTYHALIWHQLHRPSGLDKSAVLGFFITKEWPILLAAICGIYLSTKTLKPLVISLTLLALFFITFADLYYTYLGSLIFLLIIFTVFSANYLYRQLSDKKQLLFILASLHLSLAAMNLWDYQQNTMNLGRFENLSEIIEFTKTLPRNFPIYGSHEIAPLIALQTDRPLFGNYIETNGQAFESGALNRTQISQAAAQNGVYLISRLIDRPEINTTSQGYESFFDKQVFESSCKELKRFNSLENELQNRIVIYECKSK